MTLSISDTDSDSDSIVLSNLLDQIMNSENDLDLESNEYIDIKKGEASIYSNSIPIHNIEEQI